MKIFITGERARLIDKEIITSGSVGYPLELEFDAEWDGLSKTAVFQSGDTAVSVILNPSATSVIVPWEVLQTPNLELLVGIYGFTLADDETVTKATPTIYCKVGKIQVGTNPNDADPPMPSPTGTLIEQLQQEVERLDEEKADKTYVDAHIDDTDVHTTAEEKASWDAKYTMPEGGIPEDDLAEDVQESLDKADSAMQKFEVTYDVTTAQEIEAALADGKQIECYYNGIKYDYFGVNNGYHCFTSFITVYITGLYVKGSTWGITNVTVATADSIPTKVSDLINDVNYTTEVYIEENYYNKDDVDASLAGKVDVESGKGLSTNDYDDIAKAKVDAIPHDPKYTDTVYDDTAVRGRLSAIEGKESSWDAKSDFSGEYDDLIGKPSVDEAPTEDSQNLVYSGGVHSFVNSSVSTNTAYYISDDGEPFTSVEDLEAYTGTVTNNDYAFVTGTDEDGNIFFDRYKATVIGTTVSWAKEYRLNNSSFTASQWAAISSGVTDVLVAAYNAHVANSGIHVSATDRTNWNGKYSKPSSGIPATDLASAVRGSLAKADSAVQPEPGKGLFSGSWNDLTDKPDISGAFNVVYGTTTASEIEEAIEEGKQPVCYRNDIRYDYAGINNGYHCFTSVISVFVEGIYVSGSDWGEMSIAIATGDMIPTKTSDLTNDSGFLTDDELDGYATEEWVEDQGYLTEHQSLSNYYTKGQTDALLNSKADTEDIPSLEGYATEQWVEDKGYLTEHQSLSAYRTASAQDTIDAGKENTSNKVTSISASSTNAQYPSAKCVYDAIQAAIGNAIGGSY